MTVIKMKFEIAPKSTEVRLNWEDARLYCFSLAIDGKTGWRLPTKEELNEIYESEIYFVTSGYWSSLEFSTGKAWIQAFYTGLQRPSYKTNHFFVRAIRDLKDNRKI